MAAKDEVSGSASTFAFPAGILLFNRPAYAERALRALSTQTIPLDSSRLTIFRDGYVGSKDEHVGRPDATSEVDALVARYFPLATYVTSNENVGVAQAYELLYEEAFRDGSDWAAFFEEDFVVDSDYLDVLSQFIRVATPHPEIQTVSATGDVAVKHDRGMHALYTDRHLWAYALRRTGWIDMRSTMDTYIRLIQPGRYWQRDWDTVVDGLVQSGLLVAGTSQDFVKFSWMHARGFLALNTGQAHGEYIGVDGLHSTSKTFAKRGYAAPRAARDDRFTFPSVTPELLETLGVSAVATWATWFSETRNQNRAKLANANASVKELRQRNATLAKQLGDSEAERQRLETELSKTLSARLSSVRSRIRRKLKSDPANRPHAIRGGWTWFGGTSALSIGDVHLVGYVRRRPQVGDGASFVGVFDSHGKPIRSVCVLPGLQLDDHNVPTIVALNNEDFVVGVTGHNQNSTVRIFRGKITTDDVVLADPVVVDFSGPTSYVHLVPEGPDSVLILTRLGGQNFVSRRFSLITNEPLSGEMTVFPWQVEPGDALASGRDGGRPYLITRESGDGVVFTLTNDHPRAYRNGVVAGRFRGGQIFNLENELVHTLSETPIDFMPFEKLSTIIAPGGEEIPWVHDVQVRADGSVEVAVSLAELDEKAFRRGRDQVNHSLRYQVVRRDVEGATSVVCDAPAGRSLFDKEEHYSGGIALNPQQPDHVIYSTSHFLSSHKNEKNQTGWSLVSHERVGQQVQDRLVDPGTQTTSVIRPKFSTVAPGSSGHALFAMKGTYSSYVDFDTVVMCIPFRPGESCSDNEESHVDLMYPVTMGGAMPQREERALRRLLRRSRTYLEFGAGGSTLRALDLVRDRVVSVESDAYLAEHIRRVSSHRTRQSPRLECVVPPVDMIRGWGHPVAESGIEKIGEEYARSAVDLCEPDLVLVDGRFRVACALTVASTTRRAVKIAIDDYTSRPGYRVVEEFLGRPRLHGRLAVFVVKNRVRIPEHVLATYFAIAG